MIPSRVKTIVGISEQELVKCKDRLKYIHVNEYGKLYFENNDKIQTFIGTFNIVNIGSLKNMVKKVDINQNPKRRKCIFEIMDNVDIGKLQGLLKTKDRAIVQVASNFNCLEVPSRYSAPNSGDLTEYAHMDSTQGPAATFGPLAAYIYRTHFSLGNFSGQTLKNQLDLLDDVQEYLGKSVNGKLTLSGKEKSIKDIDSVVDNIKIGLHCDISVLYARDEFRRHFELDQPCPIIDQCFNSTINTQDYGAIVLPAYKINKIMQTLLRAAYESVYLSAIVRKRKVVYLTLVGGGVFHNPINMICQEIIRAHNKWANHPGSCIEKVYLCMYNPDRQVNEIFSECRF